ncbi:UNVERIFIED_CONTAM: hypothetical protein HDU68_000263 [Siphonaria sp. JEL0065]|nr:hypothetical protein HDU68_000263 [Siphonaria sp. JEL0065]
MSPMMPPIGAQQAQSPTSPIGASVPVFNTFTVPPPNAPNTQGPLPQKPLPGMPQHQQYEVQIHQNHSNTPLIVSPATELSPSRPLPIPVQTQPPQAPAINKKKEEEDSEPTEAPPPYTLFEPGNLK